MKTLMKLTVLLSAILLLTACAVASPSESTIPKSAPETSSAAQVSSSETNTGETGPTEKIPLPPVENNSPNTLYEPFFPEQTRAAGVKTDSSYQVTVLTTELNSPWAVAGLPDGRLVISEKGGTIRIATMSGDLSAPINSLPALDTRNQGGLLDITAAPDFTTSRMLYMTLAEKTTQGSLTAVARARLSDDEKTLEQVEVIWRAIPYYDNGMHFGSRLVFDPSGNLFVSTGERSDLATRPMAQALDNGYGKVVHITTEGQPVTDNPWIGQASVLPEIYSYGHRNAQGLAIHPVTGELWLNEMGPRGGDELNLIKPGRNYGWPIISYGIEYSGQPISGALTEKEGMEQPVYYWDPVLAPSGMTFYPFDTMPEWENNLFIAGLRGQHIARLVLDGERVIGEERLLESEEQRFRDVTAGADSALYAVTDQGRLYRIG